MRNISLLDCTLRDGGYVNDWKFGKANIAQIVRKVIQSGVDIIELGYLSEKNSGSEDTARYSSIEDVRRAYAADKSQYQSYAVMVNFGEFPADKLPQAESDSPIIRVAFHKKDLDAAFEYIENIKNKGYKFFVQPMGALNYTDEEYVSLIKRTNSINPLAFYVVDSFGVMEMKDFRRLLFLSDNNLNSDILLGYHSHNNLQQAYSNSKYMAEQNLDHDVVIDASVFGMGRGAGNLNLELFARYLNQNYNKAYNIEPMLEVFDECLKPIFIKSFWGYSLPFFLSSMHNCHPNYANFFAEKNTLSVKSMHEILSLISDEDKSSFSLEKANRYYNEYQQKHIDDRAALSEIANSIENRSVLIIAPGKSAKDNADDINKLIKKNNPVVFGINIASNDFSYDYLFVANEKRISNAQKSNVNRLIAASNLNCDYENALRVNYASYLCSDDRISDDPTLMMINVLVCVGVRKIYIAGFDGFSLNPDENYFADDMALGSKVESKLRKNSMIGEQVKRLRSQIDLEFITPSKYLNC